MRTEDAAGTREHIHLDYSVAYAVGGRAACLGVHTDDAVAKLATHQGLYLFLVGGEIEAGVGLLQFHTLQEVLGLAALDRAGIVGTAYVHSHGIVAEVAGYPVYLGLYLGLWVEDVVGVDGHMVLVGEVDAARNPHVVRLAIGKAAVYLFLALHIGKHSDAVAEHVEVGAVEVLAAGTVPSLEVVGGGLDESHAVGVDGQEELVETAGQSAVHDPVDIDVAMGLARQPYAGADGLEPVAQSAKGHQGNM